MADLVAIAGLSVAWAGCAGLVGLLVVRLLRRRSLRVIVVAVVLVSVVSVVVGLIGASRAMFLSDHDFAVATEVAVVAGLVAAVIGYLAGRDPVRHVLAVRRQAEAVGAGEPAEAVTDGPAELARLSEALQRAGERLGAARQRERRLEQSRRELVAWVSHDLRTPLAGLRALAEALEDGLTEDPQRSYARMTDLVEQLGRMIDDLFELSRIQAGAFDVTPEELSVADLVSGVIARTEPIARARGVTLDGRVEDAVALWGDPAGLDRVLLNLVTNAIRHTPYDGTVAILAGSTEAGHHLDVVDGCGGIAPDDLPYVFDVAWRGSSARDPGDPSPGAGLGLAIVKGIVEAHRGTVDVHNHEQGCRFRVRLPARVPG